jgi:hypothetical protein
MITKASLQGDVDRLLEEGLDENVESFLSQDDMDTRDSLGRCMDASKGICILFLLIPLSLSTLICMSCEPEVKQSNK